MVYPRSDKRVFLVTFSGFRKLITDYLDTRPEVLNWFAVLSNALLIVSRSDTTAITGLLHVGFPQIWFVVTEVDPLKTNGFMNQLTWDFIANPSSSGRWE